MEYRTCKVCGKTKPMSEFYSKTYTCKRCVCKCNSDKAMQRNLERYPDLPNEEWRYVPFDHNYMVSNMGRIRSLVYGGHRGKVLSLTKHHQGYLRIRFARGHSYSVHRLVAMAFIPNPENKKTINHKNGIKHDNRVENLEWATQSENNRHAIATGLKVYTERQRQSAIANVKIPVSCIFKVFELYKQGVKQCKIAEQLNVTRTFVCRVLNGKTRTSTYKVNELKAEKGLS